MLIVGTLKTPKRTIVLKDAFRLKAISAHPTVELLHMKHERQEDWLPVSFATVIGCEYNWNFTLDRPKGDTWVIETLMRRATGNKILPEVFGFKVLQARVTLLFSERLLCSCPAVSGGRWWRDVCIEQ